MFKKKYLMLPLFSVALLSYGAFKTIHINYPVADEIQTNQSDVNFSSTSDNNARNWEIANDKFLVQKLNNNTITYQINSTDDLYIKAYQAAINDWNHLGLIKLVATNQNPQITMNGNYDDNKNSYDGMTTYNVDTNSLNDDYNYAYLANTDITLSGQIVNLNRKNAFKYIKITAEHEIGHALGFAHDDSVDKNANVYIMESSTDINYLKYVNPLSNYEKATLLKHYSSQLSSNIINQAKTALNKQRKLSKKDKRTINYTEMMIKKYQ